jgi:hypothetical protein
MDKFTKTVQRLWGPLHRDGRLHGSPIFAMELSAHCDRQLSLRMPKISLWSYGEQVEHLYLATHWAFDRFEEAMSGENSTCQMGLLGYGLLALGAMPRGVFATIPPLVPASGTLKHIEPLKESLAMRLERITWNLEEIKMNCGKSLHPRMKYLSAKQWLYFISVHHHHHSKIIRDIVRAAG